LQISGDKLKAQRAEIQGRMRGYGGEPQPAPSRPPSNAVKKIGRFSVEVE